MDLYLQDPGLQAFRTMWGRQKMPENICQFELKFYFPEFHIIYGGLA